MTSQGSVGNPAEAVRYSDRPWGGFQQLATNETVTVEIITARPPALAPASRAARRALDGARRPLDIVVDDRQWTAERGETIWVPQGPTQRLGNSGALPGRLLEVAFGHFDEDDSERLEDDYDRTDDGAGSGAQGTRLSRGPGRTASRPAPRPTRPR